jgi:preprotein translocase subunit SecE
VVLLQLPGSFSRYANSSRAGFLRGLWFCTKRVDSLMARTNPITFLQQVRQEVSKVTWPSRNEVLISTVMVLVLVIAASLFFLAADQIISWLVGLMLSIRA